MALTRDLTLRWYRGVWFCGADDTKKFYLQFIMWQANPIFIHYFQAIFNRDAIIRYGLDRDSNTWPDKILQKSTINKDFFVYIVKVIQIFKAYLHP
jgi:hypothetical protein